MNNQKLFRPQAIAALQQSLTGDILIRPKLSLLAITLTLICLVSGILTWLLVSRYTQTQTVSGWLEPTQGITHVYSPDPGAVVSAVFVTENQYVEQGTPLVKLVRDTLYGDNQSIADFHLQQLTTQIDRLHSQRQYTEDKYQAQYSQLQVNLHTLQQEQHNIRQLQDLLNEKITMLQRQRDALQSLQAKGYTSEQQLQQLNSQLLDEQFQLQQLSREALNNQRALQTQSLDMASLTQDLHIQLIAIDNQIGESQRQLAQLSSTRNIVVTAPVSGVVSQLTMTLGRATHSSLPLLTLMPESMDIAARLLIPITAAGQIEPGQQVHLRYDAFPYAQFGTFPAEINYISPHLMLPEELAQTPMNIREPVYLASAIPISTSIEQPHASFNLRAGMTFNAEVAIRERNLWQWLFEPIMEIKEAML